MHVLRRREKRHEEISPQGHVSNGYGKTIAVLMDDGPARRKKEAGSVYGRVYDRSRARSRSSMWFP